MRPGNIRETRVGIQCNMCAREKSLIMFTSSSVADRKILVGSGEAIFRLLSPPSSATPLRVLEHRVLNSTNHAIYHAY